MRYKARTSGLTFIRKDPHYQMSASADTPPCIPLLSITRKLAMSRLYNVRRVSGREYTTRETEAYARVRRKLISLICQHLKRHGNQWETARLALVECSDNEASVVQADNLVIDAQAVGLVIDATAVDLAIDAYIDCIPCKPIVKKIKKITAQDAADDEICSGYGNRRHLYEEADEKEMQIINAWAAARNFRTEQGFFDPCNEVPYTEEQLVYMQFDDPRPEVAMKHLLVVGGECYRDKSPKVRLEARRVLLATQQEKSRPPPPIHDQAIAIAANYKTNSRVAFDTFWRKLSAELTTPTTPETPETQFQSIV